jgi:hypothetical protein
MYGARRPKYFNERDRRLQEHTDEKNRLLEAAREEDRLQSLEKALEGHTPGNCSVEGQHTDATHRKSA